LNLNLGRTVRAWHKWLGLLVGAQLVLWAVSGFYMVVVDLDFIHGDTLVRSAASTLSLSDDVLPVASLADRYSHVRSATLKSLPGFARPVYEIRTHEGTSVIDAVSGELLSPMSKETIETFARTYYAGRGQLVRSELLQAAPAEVRGRPMPLWKIDFDDTYRTSFYLDPVNGALVTRRHRWWRWFDTFWMLHVMDYGYERDDVNNTLLRALSGIGVIFAATGIWLLFFSFRRGQARAQP